MAQYEQFNITIEIAYRYTSKWHASPMGEMEFGLNRMENSEPLKPLCRRKKFSWNIYYEKELIFKRDRRYLVRLSWFVSPGDIQSEWALISNVRQESSNAGRVLIMFYGHAGKFLRDLVTETMVQMGLQYVSSEVVLTLSRSDYVPCGIVSNLKDYYE